MKKTLQKSLLVAALLWTSCSGEFHSRRGDKAYDQLAYANAIEHYEVARKKGEETKMLLARLADSYRKVEQALPAASLYQRLANPGAVDEYDLYYGQMLMELGKYDKAKPFIQSFAEQNQSDDRAQNLLEACESALDLQTDRGRYRLLKTNLNTEMADFGPVLYQDKLYFSSGRSEDAMEFKWDRSSFLDLYQAVFDGSSTLGEPEKVSSKINSRFHEAIPAFSPDGQTMMFTRNNYLRGKASFSESEVVKLQIYESSLKGKGWGKVKPFPHNNKDYSVGHPSFSEDGNTLYFASDMPGGRGGVDLYKCSKNGDSWGDPVNLGPQINTEGNEMFPSWANGLLTFASDGHPGLGGLDLFQTNPNQPNKILHLEAPLNSREDDFQLIIAPSGDIGFFTSNRKGGQGMDDIYAFEILPPFIGKISAKDGTPLAGASVSIQSVDGRVVVPKVDEEGRFDCGLKEGKYMVNIHQPGYEPYAEVLDVPATQTENKEAFVIAPLQECEQDEVALLAQTEMEDGQPKPEEWVRISMRDILVQSDEKGKIKVNLPPGFDFDVMLDGSNNPEGRRTISTKDLDGSGEIPLVLRRTADTIPDVIDPKSDNPFYTIYYDYGKSFIRESDARPELDRLARYMDRNPEIVVMMTSHTDARGTSGFNMRLSQKRSREAYQYLLKSGIDRRRLFYNYEGERDILNECREGVPCPEEKHQENRRTEFRLKK